MLRNNADARRCSYFELRLPVVRRAKRRDTQMTTLVTEGDGRGIACARLSDIIVGTY